MVLCRSKDHEHKIADHYALAALLTTICGLADRERVPIIGLIKYVVSYTIHEGNDCPTMTLPSYSSVQISKVTF